MVSEKYSYQVGWSDEDECFVARCLELPDIGGHGASAEEALAEAREAAEIAIQWMEEEHEKTPEPYGARNYSGNLSLRIPPETHRLIALKAALSGVSNNQFLTSLIERNLLGDTAAEMIDRISTLAETLSAVLMEFEKRQTWKQAGYGVVVASYPVSVSPRSAYDTSGYVVGGEGHLVADQLQGQMQRRFALVEPALAEKAVG